MLEQLIGALLGGILAGLSFLIYQVATLKRDVKYNTKNIGKFTKAVIKCAKKLNIVINNNGGE